MQALLLSPATRFSPDSSSSSPASPATPPPPSLDFLLLSDNNSPLGQFDTPTRTSPRQSTLRQRVSPPALDPPKPTTTSTPSWLSRELDEEWAAPDDHPAHDAHAQATSTDNSTASTTFALPSSASASASTTLLPPGHTLRPTLESAPPTSVLSTPSRTAANAAYASLPKTQPRVPSSLRHGFTASTSTAATSVVDLDADTDANADVDGTRDMSVVGLSTADNSVVSRTDDHDHDHGLDVQPQAGCGTSGDDDNGDDSVGSAGTCVVNSIVERSGSGSGSGSGQGRNDEGQLAAAVRALRGPNAGLFSPAATTAEAEDAGGQQQGLEARVGPSKGGLLGLFEPPSPPVQASSHSLPKSTYPAPSLPSFTFSPPEPVPRTSWKSLPLLSPSPSPPRTDNEATPVAAPRSSSARTAPLETPTATGAGAGAAETPLQREAGGAPTGPGRRERFLKRSAPAQAPPQPQPRAAHDAHDATGDESSDDAPFVPPPQAGTTTSESEGLSDDDEDEGDEDEREQEERDRDDLADGLGLAGPGQPGLGWSSDEDEDDEGGRSSFSRDDVSLPANRGLSALPSPPPAHSSIHLGLPLPPSPRALPSSPARIPFSSPALSSVPTAAAAAAPLPPPSPLRLFQPTYDTLTRAHLAQLVDEIDDLGAHRETYLREGAPAPPQLSPAGAGDNSDEGFLGEEGEKRSAKRIRLSPRGEGRGRRRAELSILSEEPPEFDESGAGDASFVGDDDDGAAREGGGGGAGTPSHAAQQLHNRRRRAKSRSGSTSPVSARRRSTPALRRARAYTPAASVSASASASASARSALRSSGVSLPSLPGLPFAPDSARSAGSVESSARGSPRSPGMGRSREARLDEANALMERIRVRVEEREARRLGGGSSPVFFEGEDDHEVEQSRRAVPAPRGSRPRFSRAQSTTPPSSPPPLSSSSSVASRPPPPSHFAAAASASLRSVLSSPAPLSASSSTFPAAAAAPSGAPPGSPSLALGLPPSVRAAKERGGSLGRRHFARTPIGAAGSASGKKRVGEGAGGDKGKGRESLLKKTQARRLFGTDADDAAAVTAAAQAEAEAEAAAHADSEREPDATEAGTASRLASTPAPPAAASAKPHGHARHPSLTTLHPASRDTQLLLASAGASAREKGLVFDAGIGRWIRTPRRVGTLGVAEETEEEEVGAAAAEKVHDDDDEEEEDPFRDFSELRSANESGVVGPAAGAVDLDALPHAGDGSGSLPRGAGVSDANVTGRSRSRARTSAALDLSGLGITKGTPPLPAPSAVAKEEPQPSPAGACYFEELPAEVRPEEEGAAGPQLVLESEDSATWGRSAAAGKVPEAEQRFEGAAGEAAESEDDSLAETSMLGLYRAAHAALGDPAETRDEVPPPPPPAQSQPRAQAAPPATPAGVSRISAHSVSAPTVPRSALKPARAQSAPTLAGAGTSTPLRAASEPPRAPRSVSFSDGKTSGKIEGLVVGANALVRPAMGGFGSRLKFELGGAGEEHTSSVGEGPGSLEFDEAFETQSEEDGDEDADRTVTQESVRADSEGPSVRTRGIDAALDSLARGPDDSPFGAQFGRNSLNSSVALSSASVSPIATRPRSGSRSFTRSHSQQGNATFLTECSFGVSHDRLLQYITDVEPFEPDWEHLRSIDLSCKKAESVVRMKEFLPRLDEVNLNGNELSYLTGIPKTLRTLLVASNRLTSLTSFQHLVNIERLDLSDNQLDSVHQLACLRHLRELKLDGNQVDSLDGLAGLDSLVKLSLKGNALVKVDLARTSWSRLETLHLARNKLVEIKGVERLVSLTTLNLDHNDLASFEPAGTLTRLRVLRLCGNPIASLDVSFAPKLRTLYADSARLGNLLGTDQLRKLENLSVRDQSGGALTVSMAHVRDVKRLYLSGNPLPSSFPSEKFFNLVYLELAMCQLTSLPADFASVVPNVRVLNLDHNFVGDLSPLAGLTRLTKLSVVGARISKARPLAGVLATLAELESVDLRMNPFTLAFYPPLVPPSDSLLPSHTEHRILHPDDLPSSLSASTLADPATHSSAWQVLDTKFRRALPDAWYHRRAAYRAVVMQAVPTLVRLDGIDCTKERPRLAKRVEKLAKRAAAAAV